MEPADRARGQRRALRAAAALLLLATATVAQPDPRDAPPPEPVQISLNDLFALCRPTSGQALDEHTVYQTLGVVRRSAELDAVGLFALLHPAGACCAAGIAIGFRVRSERVTEIENEAWVTVRGRLRVPDAPPPKPRSHLARVARGILRDGVEIEALDVEVYERLQDTSLKNLADRLASPSYRTFARAVRAAGWEETLRKPTYFTVLAPIDQAFARLPPAEREALFVPGNADRLEALVRRHVVPGLRTKRRLISQQSLKTLGQEPLSIEVGNGSLRVGGARVLFEDASARNGIILAIDRILPASGRAPRAPQ